MKRVRTILIILMLIASGFASTPLYASAIPKTSPQVGGRAGLVVQFGDGSYITRCISFSEESISGLELLTRSGLQIVTWGNAVCRIEREGCDYPAQPCFCQCQRAPCLYWSYWHWRDDRWVYSSVGAADYRVHNGDVEAWVWGDGNPPRIVPTEQACSSGTNASFSTPASGTMTPLAQPSSNTAPANPTRNDKQGIAVEQLVAFAILVTLLSGGVWILRKRHRGQ